GFGPRGSGRCFSPHRTTSAVRQTGPLARRRGSGKSERFAHLRMVSLSQRKSSESSATPTTSGGGTTDDVNAVAKVVLPIPEVYRSHADVIRAIVGHTS